MKLSCAKFLIPSILALSGQVAHASVYSVTLTYEETAPLEANGTLSGFVVIDQSLFDGQENRVSGDLILMPAWIQQARLTFTPDDGSPQIVATNFTAIDWNVNTGTDFDISNGNIAGSKFLDQVTRFGFYGSNYTGTPEDSPLEQQYSSGEFLLTSGVPVNPAPGPLPILGLGTFAWYFNSLKKKKNLNIKK